MTLNGELVRMVTRWLAPPSKCPLPGPALFDLGCSTPGTVSRCFGHLKPWVCRTLSTHWYFGHTLLRPARLRAATITTSNWPPRTLVKVWQKCGTNIISIRPFVCQDVGVSMGFTKWGIPTMGFNTDLDDLGVPPFRKHLMCGHFPTPPFSASLAH